MSESIQTRSSHYSLAICTIIVEIVPAELPQWSDSIRPDQSVAICDVHRLVPKASVVRETSRSERRGTIRQVSFTQICMLDFHAVVRCAVAPQGSTPLAGDSHTGRRQSQSGDAQSIAAGATRKTSAILVAPDATLRAPLTRKGSMPS